MRKTTVVVLASLFLVICLGRFCHTGILWVEEAYPTAAAQQMIAGKFLYRDIWFDKPPLYALIYLWWEADIGIGLRWAGALFIILACSLIYRFALDLWGRDEALMAACLLGFYLTFGIPSAVMALAPDLLILVPHLAAVYLAWKRAPLWSGIMAGLAFLTNAKAVLVLAVCFLWLWRSPVSLLAGFALPVAFFYSVLSANHAADAYMEQVWRWGAAYARDTFLADPLREGVSRTLNWLGFHVTAVIAAAWYWHKERSSEARRLLVWLILSAAGVAAGLRFFPRYYFQVLPVLVLVAARGLILLRPYSRVAVLCLLAIPVIRFGPRYVTLASDLVQHRPHQWADLAMNDDSRAAANLILQHAKPSNTLMVWGYRPDVFCYTKLTAGSRFLDSQPLTGVIADRHLTESRPTLPDVAAQNRAAVVKSRPTFIVDGLGPYNPALAITNFPDLQQWLANYREIGRTGGSVVYQLLPAPNGSALGEKR
jgi:hypothetical protein